MERTDLLRARSSSIVIFSAILNWVGVEFCLVKRIVRWIFELMVGEFVVEWILSSVEMSDVYILKHGSRRVRTRLNPEEMQSKHFENETRLDMIRNIPLIIRNSKGFGINQNLNQIVE